MGRPTSEIWLHYTTERAAGRTAVYCRYCSQKYGYPNATKMKIHTMKCAKCPEEVRRQFESTAKPESTEGQDITSRRLSADGDVAVKADPTLQYQAQQPQQTPDRPTECTNRSKTGSFRIDLGAENPSNSRIGFQTPGNCSVTKSQSIAKPEVFSSVERASGKKPQQRQFPNTEKSFSAKVTDIKQHSCSSSPEKVKISSRLQQQHSRPLSRSEDRVSLIPERMCQHPVF